MAAVKSKRNSNEIRTLCAAHLNMINNVVGSLVTADAHSAVKYASDNFVVRATRRLFDGKIDRRSRTIDIVLTMGRPNYAERQFIKRAKAAGESFPIRKVQLKFPPKRR